MNRDYEDQLFILEENRLRPFTLVQRDPCTGDRVTIQSTLPTSKEGDVHSFLGCGYREVKWEEDAANRFICTRCACGGK